jgi:hypothetical protein
MRFSRVSLVPFQTRLKLKRVYHVVLAMSGYFLDTTLRCADALGISIGHMMAV